MTKDQAEREYQAAVKRTADVIRRMQEAEERQDETAYAITQGALSEAAKVLSATDEVRRLYIQVSNMRIGLMTALEFFTVTAKSPVIERNRFLEAQGAVNAAAERFIQALDALPQD